MITGTGQKNGERNAQKFKATVALETVNAGKRWPQLADEVHPSQIQAWKKSMLERNKPDSLGTWLAQLGAGIVGGYGSV